MSSQSMKKADDASNIKPEGMCSVLLPYSYKQLVKVTMFQMAQIKY